MKLFKQEQIHLIKIINANLKVLTMELLPNVHGEI